MASASRYGGVMLSKMVASSSSRALLMPARAFSTSVAFQAPRNPGSQPAATKDAQPKVRSNPLVGNYIPPQPVQLKPDEVPPVSTEHPRSTKPPRSSAEVPPNADMPPPPPPPPSASFEQSLPPSKADKSSFTYDALTEKPTTASKSSSTASASSADAYKRIDIMDIISNKANAFSTSLNANDPTALPNIRAAPVVGRTVHIRQRGGLNSAPTQTSAFRVLQRIVTQEKVKGKFHMQRFHERKGLKRKRLSSERWRARFRDGFKATVDRVMELKRQGW